MKTSIISQDLQTFITGLADQRNAALAQLKPGNSMLTLTVRKSGIKLICIYKKHDKATITIQSSKQTLDHLFRGKNLVLSGSFSEQEDMTFNLVDVEIKNG